MSAVASEQNVLQLDWRIIYTRQKFIKLVIKLHALQICISKLSGQYTLHTIVALFVSEQVNSRNNKRVDHSFMKPLHFLNEMSAYPHILGSCVARCHQ